jgi:hypothetical protein
MRLTRRDDGDNVSAGFSSFGRTGARPPFHKDPGLQSNADLSTVMGMLAPSAARLNGRINTIAVAFKPEVLGGRRVFSTHENRAFSHTLCHNLLESAPALTIS